MKRMLASMLGVVVFLCSAFAVNVGQEYDVLAAENVFEMTKGGSIRTAEPYGLRFQVKMSEDVKAKADKVGMMIFPADYLVNNGAEGDVYYSSVEELAATSVSNHKMDLDLTSNIFEKDGYWYGNGAIVNIKEKNMAREFVGLAYYEVNGTKTWADTGKITDTSRSASQVALLSHADDTTSYSEETKELLLKYVDRLKATDVEESAPTRYKTRGFVNNSGLYFYVEQYVEEVVATGDAWTEQTHLEMDIWQEDMGNTWEGTHGAFWLDGNYSLDSDNNISLVKNNVTISDRGEDFADGYRYKISYEIFIQLVNDTDDTCAYVQFKHYMPGETEEGFEACRKEYVDNNRYLWQDDCESYEIRGTGIVLKETIEKGFTTNLKGWSAVSGNWAIIDDGLKTSNLERWNDWYVSEVSVASNISWIYEADLNVTSVGAGGIVVGIKDPANMDTQWICLNTQPEANQFKLFKVGSDGWPEITIPYANYPELTNPGQCHIRFEYDANSSTLTYKIAPYGTQDYVIVGSQYDASLAAYDGSFYFGLNTFWSETIFNNVKLSPLALTFDSNNNAIVEGENLIVADVIGTGQVLKQDMTPFGVGVWSNDEHFLLVANATEQSVKFYLNIEEEGDYDLSGVFTKSGDFGIYQHYIDGEKVGGNIDIYVNDIWNTYVTKTSEVYIGYAHLTPGVHILEAKCVGKNSQSVGYVYGIDYLKVSKASTTHVYEAEDLTITNGTATYGYQGGIDICSQTRQFLQLNNGVGDYVEFNIYINKDGYYDINAALTKSTDFSIVQHYIDGTKLGPEVDSYNYGFLNPGETSLGHVYLEKGIHTIKAVVVGKNENSVGYVYGLDYLKVSEVAESNYNTYEYENTDLRVVAYHSSNENPDNHVWTQDGNFSGGNQLLFFGAAKEDYITVEFDVPKNGYYNMSTVLCRVGDFGIVQHYVDDVKLGEPINNYTNGFYLATVEVGEVYLTAGTHTLKAVMIATESGYTPGYLYGLDKLILKEVNPQGASGEMQYINSDEWLAVNGTWSQTENGIQGSGEWDNFYVTKTNVSAKKSWAYEADMSIDSTGGASGIMVGVKDPKNMGAQWICLNTQPEFNQFKLFKVGGTSAWASEVVMPYTDYPTFGNHAQCHVRFEYDAENSTLTYKIAPYGTEDYAIVGSIQDDSLAAYDGNYYFGVMVFYGTGSFDNMKLQVMD